MNDGSGPTPGVPLKCDRPASWRRPATVAAALLTCASLSHAEVAASDSPARLSKKARCTLSLQGKTVFNGICVVTRKPTKNLIEIGFEGDSEDRYVVVGEHDGTSKSVLKRDAEGDPAEADRVTAPLGEIVIDGNCWRGPAVTFCVD